MSSFWDSGKLMHEWKEQCFDETFLHLIILVFDKSVDYRVMSKMPVQKQ